MSGVSWREAPKWSWESEGSGEILWRKGLWSHVRCSPNSSGIQLEKPQSGYLEKSRLQKVFNKMEPFIKRILMKDQKDEQCRFIFTAMFDHIYQGCQ